MGRKVLVGMDGSPHCERALHWYSENMRNSTDELIFIYVVEPPPIPVAAGLTASATSDIYSSSVNDAIHVGKKLASSVKSKCIALGLTNSTRFLERMTHGAGPAIVDVANEENVDFILMGNRGKGTLRRTFLGSVSDYVLHHAHRTVIIVPPPRTERKISKSN